MRGRIAVLLLWLMVAIGAGFADSSASYLQVVNQLKPSARVTAAPSSAVVNSTVVTITANVASPAGVPTGTVTLTDGTTTIGVLTLSGGLATTTQVFSTVGSHDLNICYSGDQNFLSTCTSDGNGNAVVTVTDFSLTVAPSISGVIPAGQAWTTVVSIKSINGFAGPVALSCSGLPGQMGCSFSPSVVNVVSGDPTSNLTISTLPATSAVLSMPFGMIGMAGLVLPWCDRRRKSRWVLPVFAVLVLALGLVGCGTGMRYVQTDGVTKQTYNITVTGTSGNLRHSATVTVTVQGQSQTLR